MYSVTSTTTSPFTLPNPSYTPSSFSVLHLIILTSLSYSLLQPLLTTNTTFYTFVPDLYPYLVSLFFILPSSPLSFSFSLASLSVFIFLSTTYLCTYLCYLPPLPLPNTVTLFSLSYLLYRFLYNHYQRHFLPVCTCLPAYFCTSPMHHPIPYPSPVTTLPTIALHLYPSSLSFPLHERPSFAALPILLCPVQRLIFFVTFTSKYVSAATRVEKIKKRKRWILLKRYSSRALLSLVRLLFQHSCVWQSITERP